MKPDATSGWRLLFWKQVLGCQAGQMGRPPRHQQAVAIFDMALETQQRAPATVLRELEQ